MIKLLLFPFQIKWFNNWYQVAISNSTWLCHPHKWTGTSLNILEQRYRSVQNQGTSKSLSQDLQRQKLNLEKISEKQDWNKIAPSSTFYTLQAKSTIDYFTSDLYFKGSKEPQ